MSDSKFVDVLREINKGIEAAGEINFNQNDSNGGNYPASSPYNFTAQNPPVRSAGSSALMVAVGGIAVIGGAAWLSKKYMKD